MAQLENNKMHYEMFIFSTIGRVYHVWASAQLNGMLNFEHGKL